LKMRPVCNQKGKQTMKTLKELYNSPGFLSYRESKLGNDLFINDPDRAKRIHEAAEDGIDGSYHGEVIQDWQEYLDSLAIIAPDWPEDGGDITQADYDAIQYEINSCYAWHEKNESLWIAGS